MPEPAGCYRASIDLFRLKLRESMRFCRQKDATYTVSLRGAKGKEEVLEVPSDRYILDIADEKVGEFRACRAEASIRVVCAQRA